MYNTEKKLKSILPWKMKTSHGQLGLHIRLGRITTPPPPSSLLQGPLEPIPEVPRYHLKRFVVLDGQQFVCNIMDLIPKLTGFM